MFQLNIRRFVNCTEIEGNIELLNHVFDKHIEPGENG